MTTRCSASGYGSCEKRLKASGFRLQEGPGCVSWGENSSPRADGIVFFCHRAVCLSLTLRPGHEHAVGEPGEERDTGDEEPVRERHVDVAGASLGRVRYLLRYPLG